MSFSLFVLFGEDADWGLFFDSVDKCITLCGLEQYKHAMVGTLNVENRKRTTIGVELAAKVR